MAGSNLIARSAANVCSRGLASTTNKQMEYLDIEECILVNGNDEYVGKATKRNCHSWPKIEAGGMLHRAFSVFVFNDYGELLLQKRAQTKVTFPGVWSNSCCSHPLHVESEMKDIRKAAYRKVIHELGVDGSKFSSDDFRFISRVLYKWRFNEEWGEHELDHILFMKANLTPLPNLDEVEMTMFASKSFLKTLLKKSATGNDFKFSPWFLLMAQDLLFKWWDKLDKLEEIEGDIKIHHLT